MKVVNHDEEKDIKLLCMVGGCVIFFLIALVIGIAFHMHQAAENATESVTENATEIATEIEAVISTEKVIEESEELSTEIETETEVETEAGIETFPIENSEEFIKPMLGFFSGKVNDAVSQFVLENGLMATEAECLDCAVALDTPSNTEFYLKLNDEAGTLLTARYSPEEKKVSVSFCVYSLEEVENEVWFMDNGPAIRDTTEEPIEMETEETEAEMAETEEPVKIETEEPTEAETIILN